MSENLKTMGQFYGYDINVTVRLGEERNSGS